MSTLLLHLSKCRKPMHTSGEQLWYTNPTWTALESGHHGASRQVRTNLLPGAFFRLALSFHETLLSIGKQRDLHFTASNCDLILCFYKRCKYYTLTFCNVAHVSVHIKYLLSSTLNLKEKRFVAFFFGHESNWQAVAQNLWETLLSWLKGLSHYVLKGHFWRPMEEDATIQQKVNTFLLWPTTAREFSFNLFFF